jgi:quinolinate synthase
VRDGLDRGQGEITLDEDIRARAQGCIQRMLDFTAAQAGAAAGATPPASGFVPKNGAA